MSDLAQVIAQIRFQLGELSARNAHHLFEELCRHLARARLYSNLLPSTGPVSAGGDGGRDFETFDSGLTQSSSLGSSFLARVADQPVVFACSLEQTKGLPKKIKADVDKAVNSDPPFHEVVFFATANLPAAKRQSLENWAKSTHKTRLQIFDGQALAEMLADPEVFWIAMRYLNLPLNLFPVPRGKKWYAALHTRWSALAQPSGSDAEYVEVRKASRHAVHKEVLKPDLPMWIDRLEAFERCGGETGRRARYELLYTHLRGLGTLIGQEARLETFMQGIESLETPAAFEDAINLLTYAFAAQSHGLLSIDKGRLSEWRTQLLSRFDALLGTETRPGVRCSLLENRATMAVMHLLLEEQVLPDVLEGLPWLEELIALVPAAPLYPIERLITRINKWFELFGDHRAYDPVLDALERIVCERRGNSAAAEVARDRAIAARKSDELVRALHHAHRAKLLWFNASTLRGTLLSLLLIAELYRSLHLDFAAKHYALAAAFLAQRSADIADRDLVPPGLMEAAQADCILGAWAGYLDLIEVLFRSHGAFVQNAADPRPHEVIEHTIGQLMLNSGVARRLGGDGPGYIARVFQRWGFDLNDYVADAETIIASWGQNLSEEDFWTAVAEQLHGTPFSDLGPEREATFECLGVTWTVHWRNDTTTNEAAEEFLCGLQVLLADLAELELCLLPVPVRLRLELGDTRISVATFNFAAGDLEYHIQLSDPRAADTDEADLTLAPIEILKELSLLPDDRFMDVIGERFAQGLGAKLYFGRPYAEVLRYFASEEIVAASNRTALHVTKRSGLGAKAVPALAWRSGPGPNSETTLEAIRLRYERIPKMIPFTLALLSTNPPFQTVLATLRGEGWRDWHLLSAVVNIAMNARHPVTRFRARGTPAGQLQPEQVGDVPLDTTLFSLEQMRQSLSLFQASMLHGLGLVYKVNLLVESAVDRVLRERYGFWSEDCPHADPFAPIDAGSGLVTPEFPVE